MTRLDCNKLNILLVEDNLLNQTIAMGLLEDMGATVQVAADGRKCIEQLSQSEQAFDMVLMDIQMPVMDGIDATQFIREQMRLTIPIIAMSASVLTSDQERYRKAGMNDFVAKPINVSELQKVITRYHPSARASAGTSRPQATQFTDIFDPTQLLDLLANKPERKARIINALAEFVASGLQPLNDAINAIQNGQQKQAEYLIHTLKGFICNYGTGELYRVLQQLEVDITQEKAYDDLQNNFKHSADLLQLFINEAKAWLQQQIVTKSPQTENQDIKIELPDHIKKSIISASRLNNLTKIEEELNSLVDMGQQGAILAAEIRRLVENYDTDAIIRLVEGAK